MADMKADKHALAEQLGSFVESHGVEEAGKLLSRFLLGLAHSVEATEIEFTDHVITDLAGDPLTGTDLIGGSEKRWTFRVTGEQPTTGAGIKREQHIIWKE